MTLMYELGVRAILTDSKNRILLVKNLRGIHSNKWVLPGGKVDNGELAMDSVKREIKEELGLNFTPTLYDYGEDLNSSKDKYYLILYFTGDFSGDVVCNRDELSEFGYFTFDQIKLMDSKDLGHKRIITKYFENKND